MLVVREDIATQLNVANDRVFRVARENENQKANLGTSATVLES